MKQLTLDQHFARHFRLENDALCARLGPLPIARALAGLSWQSQLLVPAKFALSQTGDAELQAEIPLVAERRLCEKLADSALDAALLGEQTDDAPRDEDAPGTCRPEIEDALGELPWGFRETGADRYQIDAAPSVGHAMRVTVAGTAGALHAATRTSLRTDSQQARLAFRFLALESNNRLRLARIGVTDLDDGAAIVWDAVAPAGLPSAAAIPAIVDAVVHAQMLTRRSFSVLSDPRVAATYLRDRPSTSAFGESGQPRVRDSQERQQTFGTRTSVSTPTPHAVAVEPPR
jgi:hypothetical protein